MDNLIKDARQLRNATFKGMCYPELGSVNAITLDPANVELINPDVITVENLWEVCMLMSLCTVNSGKYVLYKADVLDNVTDEKSSPKDLKALIPTLLILYGEGRERCSVIKDLEKKNNINTSSRSKTTSLTSF